LLRRAAYVGAMRNLVRKPLTWIVLAECALVAALVMVAWHMVAGAPAQEVPAAPGASAPATAGDATGPVSVDVSAQSPPIARGLLPGLNVDANFWRVRLAELNRSEAAFEVLEWKLVHSAMDTAHRYVESVVLPSIARAERGGV
jgi:hypothetical protein